MKQHNTHTLTKLADYLDASLHGDGNCQISGIGTLQTAQAGQLAFLDNPLYIKYLAQTKASAVIIAKEFLEKCPSHALVTTDPYFAYSKAVQLFDTAPTAQAGIHPSAVVEKTSNIHPTASIGAQCVIGAGVTIGQNVIIGAGCVIGDDSQIDDDTQLFAKVTLYHNIIVGKRCRIHSGAVLGADGFGLAKQKGQWHRIAQIGRVVLGDDVDIGANTTIDRGAIDDTVIGNGVKLDNQIQVGHNVTIGKNTAIAAATAIGGSTKIGADCVVGGASAMNGHITINDNVMVAGASNVRGSIKKPGVYSSSLSVQDERQWRKNFARLRQLDQVVRRLQGLEKSAKTSNKTECEESHD